MTSTSVSYNLTDGSGNLISYRIVQDGGRPVVLTFVQRTDSDVKASRIKAYRTLVP